MNTQSIETNTNGNANSSIEAPANGTSFAAAYERRLAEIQAVKEGALVPPNLDLHSAVATVLGALPEIRALREEMSKLQSLDAALVDGLEDYAQAAAYANTQYEVATTPSPDIGPLTEAAMNARETLRVDSIALVSRGLIDPTRLAALKGANGYKNVAFELMDWAELMRTSWPQIQGKTALSLEEIESAAELAERLVVAVGLRERAPAVIAEVARLRHQALSLLVTAYDEVRRAIHFLRWREDDADTIAPSLYLSHRKKGAGPSAGGTQSGQTGQPGQTGQTGAATPAIVAQLAAQAPPVAPGMPGGSPLAKA